MGRFIWILIILIVSVWLGLQIAKDPGLALFTFRQWSVEMPLWFAIVCFLLILWLGYLLLRFLGGIDTAFYRWKNWLQWRRKHKAYSKTNRGLIELIEGHWKNAEYYLAEGVPQSDAPLINYLGLAKAAHELGKYDRSENYLRQAHASARHADIAIGLTQAQLQLDQGKLEQAHATLTHLRQLAPRHPRVLKLLERVYVHLGDWKNLLDLLPSLYKAKVVNQQQYALLQKKVYLELLLKTTPNTLDDLHTAWKKIPRKLTKAPELIAVYAKKLLVFPQQENEVERLINASLKKSWDAPLVKLYGELQTTQPQQQLAHAEKWLKLYPDQPVLLLTLGRLCVRCQLWGKARSYLVDSLKLEAAPETYAEYGKLLEKLGDTAMAMKSYYDGLVLSGQ